jgi:hypothetical protein
MLTTKEEGYPSDFRGSQNYLRRRKRFPQTKGVVYDETFDPIARYTPICTIIHELETTSDGCKDNLSQW